MRFIIRFALHLMRLKSIICNNCYYYKIRSLFKAVNGVIFLYELYEYSPGVEYIPNVKIDQYTYGVFKPSVFRLHINSLNFKQWIMNLYWYILNNGKYSIYYICYRNEIIHTSYCMPKSYKFPFMSKNDIQIGPCNTSDQYRGKGLFPYALSMIIDDYYKNGTKLYMIINQENIPSQKGASKIGFKKVNLLQKNNCLKIYKITD